MAVKILAADDSATMRKVLEMTFAGEAVELETVDSGEAAVERASKSPPDLVIADLSMDTDGYEVARALKSSAATSQVAVMVMSSQHLEFDAQRAAGAGVDDFIVKPYDSQAMIDKVKDVLAKPRSAATETGAPAAKAAPAKPVPARPARPGVGRPRGTAPTPSPRSTVAFGAAGGRPALELADDDPSPPKRPVPAKPAAKAPARPVPKRPAAPAAKKPPALPGRAPTGAGKTAASSKAGSSPGRAAAATASGSEMAGKLSDLGLTTEQVEGVLALSREVIEQVVWEVVPDLAEVLIKEEIKRLTE
ncbi:MAG: response regulator [Sandaracinaceae bacterium]